MAAFEGLTEAQNRSLAGVQVGDLLIIAIYPKGNDAGSEAEFEYGSEDSEDSEASDDSEVVETSEAEGSVEQIDPEEVDEEASHEDASNGDANVDGEEDSDGKAEDVRSHRGLYEILEVVKDDEERIIDINLCLLTYQSKPRDAIQPCFQVYGTDIAHTTNVAIGAEESVGKSITTITAVVANDRMGHSIYVDLTGDAVRHILFFGRCPAQCTDGYISTQRDMHELVEEDILTVAEHSPICPVCMGKALMQEFQGLRETLENFNTVDLGLAVEFYGRLNTRRGWLGYRFKRFDEREWGYLFDDMPEEDDNEDNGQNSGNGNQWGYWPEALDPSSCVVLHPTSDATISSLPRKVFAEVEKTEEVECLVCKEDFRDDTVVVELPCGHVFCDAGCVEAWLKQFNSCPTCRMKLPAKEDKQVDAE